MFSLLSGTLDMNTVYKNGFHFDTMQTIGPRFGCGSPFMASTIITEHRRQMELIQMIEYIGFPVNSHYETSRVFILPPPLQIIKRTDNRRKKRKKNPNNLFLICLGLHSRLLEAFRIAFQSVQSSHSLLK